MNALSEYQLTISLAVPRSRKFCSVSLACHHFCAALFQPTDLCSISTCTLQQPSYCFPLSLSLSHSLSLSVYLSLSVFISLSHFAPSLSLWTDSQYATAATGSDQRIRGRVLRLEMRGGHTTGAPRLYVTTRVLSWVILSRDCACARESVCSCEWMCGSSSSSSSGGVSVWPRRLEGSRGRAPRFNRNISSGGEEADKSLES